MGMVMVMVIIIIIMIMTIYTINVVYNNNFCRQFHMAQGIHRYSVLKY